MVMALPSGKTIQWKRGAFQVYCCVNAFDAQETCQLVICHNCHIAHTTVWNAEKGLERKKRSRNNGGESVAVSTKVKTKGDCPRHTRADLRHLELMMNNKYCARVRTKERGYKNLAKICHECGDEL